MKKAIVITLGVIIGVTGVLAICAHLADAAKLALYVPVGEDMAFRLSRDFSALKCWTVPRMALRMRTAKMTKISTDPPAFRVRPAQPEEAGAFFAQTPEQNAQMGAIGCVRMDFGKRGTAFWHTWHPRGREELNSPEFRAELQQVVDTLRETVLKDLSSMRHFCYENGGKIPGGWSQNYGYVVETEHYEYCLRCNPVPGDYQAYLSCYDLNEQKINHAYQPLVGRIHFINGDAQQFTDAKAYLDCVREELPHEATTGFRFRTITQDPAVRKAVDDIVFDLYGEENPCNEEDYNLAPSEEIQMGGM